MAGLSIGGRVGGGIQFVKSSEVLHISPPIGVDCLPVTASSDSFSKTMLPGGSSGGTASGSDIGHEHPTPLSTVQFPGSNPDKDAASSAMDASSSEMPDKRSGGMGSGHSSGNTQLGQFFVRAGEKIASTVVQSRGPARNPKKGAAKSPAPVITFPPTPQAKPVLTKEEYLTAWKNETNTRLQKFRKLAYEVLALKTDRPNAKDKLHSAANRVPIRIEFNTEPVLGFKNNNSFICYVFADGVCVASGQGLKIKDSKTNAYEAALQKILMPHIRIIQLDPESRELEGSKEPFTSPPPEPSELPLPKSTAKLPPSSAGAALKESAPKEVVSQHKESNLEAACLKRRLDEQKPLEDFVIVEPMVPIPDCTPAHTLRRSADFNHMLLEYEYFFKGEAARCTLKVENQVLADVNGPSKVAAKNIAASQALKKLKNMCWVIKTKQAVDSDTKISKEDMLNEMYDQSDETIGEDNIGNRLLRKMGWAGGGMGKDGSGIAEPVSLTAVLNREGLGLGSRKGVTEEFKRRVKDVIEGYAASDIQEDLVFSYDFRLDERQVIHDECRRLNLRSKSRGKGKKRYLCVRRKRSANELFDHIMSSGGETARYILVPPGSEVSGPEPAAKKGPSSLEVAPYANDGKVQVNENVKKGSTKGSNSRTNTSGYSGNGLLPTPVGFGLFGNAPAPHDAPTGFPRNGSLLHGMPGNSMGNIQGNDPGSQKIGAIKKLMRGLQYKEDDLRMENRNLGSRFAENVRGNNRLFGKNYGLGNMQGMENQWGMQQNNEYLQGKGNWHNGLYDQDMGVHSMRNGGQNMGNGDRSMGIHNMGNGDRSMGIHNMVNGGQSMGIQNRVNGGQSMGIQNMGNGGQILGMQNMVNGGRSMGIQNMGNGGQIMGMQNMVNGGRSMGIQNMVNAGQRMGLLGMGNIEDMKMQRMMNGDQGIRMPAMGIGMGGAGRKNMRTWGQLHENYSNQGDVQQNWGNFQGVRMQYRGGDMMQGPGNHQQNMGMWQGQGRGNFR